jgi:hypothetical protein
MTYQSKDNIKLSMMRHAVTHWGLAEEDFSSFDPIVELLIESCANELYKITNELKARTVGSSNAWLLCWRRDAHELQTGAYCCESTSGQRADHHHSG